MSVVILSLAVNLFRFLSTNGTRKLFQSFSNEPHDKLLHKVVSLLPGSAGIGEAVGESSVIEQSEAAHMHVKMR